MFWYPRVTVCALLVCDKRSNFVLFTFSKDTFKSVKKDTFNQSKLRPWECSHWGGRWVTFPFLMQGMWNQIEIGKTHEETGEEMSDFSFSPAFH